MPEIYGGLWLENLVNQDVYFDVQCKLFQASLIKGIQLRVAHPYYTPGIVETDLPEICDRLPTGMRVFVHYGAENVGVDFGETFDECNVYIERGFPAHISWETWNRQTLHWGTRVAMACQRPDGEVWGVVHPGYGASITDTNAYRSMIKSLARLSSERVCLETVPPLVKREWYAKAMGKAPDWPADEFWGFGGTPRQMSSMLDDLGDGWKCFIDVTYVNTISVQSRLGIHDTLLGFETFEETFAAYAELPHSRICHFSGITDDPSPRHDGSLTDLSQGVLHALRHMRTICLEISFSRDTAEQDVERFSEAIAS